MHTIPVRIALFTLGSLAVILFSGCAGKPPVTAPETLPPAVAEMYPYDLQLEPGNEQMTVQWKVSGEALMTGYNIYIAKHPFAGGAIDSPFNSAPYPGDTNLDDSVITFDAVGLENGTKYFVSVRVVKPDQSLSRPTNEAMTICGPRGTVVLDHRFSGSNDGFSLVRNQYSRADSDQNDFYYYQKDGVDYLASPDRLNGYNRKSRFARLSMSGELRQVRSQIAGQGAHPKEDRVTLRQGDWILILTNDQQYGLLHVSGFTGVGSTRKVTLETAFCPARGELVF